MKKHITALNRLLSTGTPLDIKVNHYFSDGICIREAIIPAGALAVGATHKTNHITMLLQGTLQVYINGESRLVEAPYTFEALKGSNKIVFAYTDCVVSNVLPTESRDIYAIEEMFTCMHEEIDRLDFFRVLGQHGVTKEQVDKLAFNETTYQSTGSPHTIKDSPVHGKGLFSSLAYKQGDTVGLASEYDTRYELGRYVNHSKNPNLQYDFTDGICVAIAKTDINIDDELTVCYNENFTKLKEIQCQQ